MNTEIKKEQSMIKTVLVVLSCTAIAVVSSVALAEDQSGNSELTYEEQQRAENPNLGDCDLPNEIDGGTLITYDGNMRLGWWSHCEEGNFLSVPISPDIGDFQTVYGSVETSHAYLNCRRMHKDVLLAGEVARYACTSTDPSRTLGAFGLTYYAVVLEGIPV